MRCLDIHYRASGDGFDTWETWFCLGGCRDPHQLMSELSAVIQQCSHGGVEGHWHPLFRQLQGLSSPYQRCAPISPTRVSPLTSILSSHPWNPTKDHSEDVLDEG